MLSAMLDNPVLERLQRYEQQLRNAIYRGLKELRTLRKEEPAGTTDVAAEALEIEPEPAEKQIEPTEPLSSAPAGVYIEPAGGSAEPGASSILHRAIAEAARAVVASKTLAI